MALSKNVQKTWDMRQVFVCSIRHRTHRKAYILRTHRLIRYIDMNEHHGRFGDPKTFEEKSVRMIVFILTKHYLFSYSTNQLTALSRVRGATHPRLFPRPAIGTEKTPFEC